MTKFNRRSRFDDVLFAIAVLVPVVFATARFVDSERQADVVAQAQQRGGAVAVAAREMEALLVLADSTQEAH
jgi:hypothetical protein